MSNIPKKLKADAIAEALLEVRFQCKEATQLPELVVGKLADNPVWKDYEKARLPVSEIPASLRAQDENLRFQPLLEVRDAQKVSVAKIGSNVLSYHRLAPYPGGDTFVREVNQCIDFLFKSLTEVTASRLGLRYINLFTEAEHGIKSVNDLDQKITLAGAILSAPLNLNYRAKWKEEFESIVKIASPEFVAGAPSKPFVALVDVDVFTPKQFTTSSAEAVKNWVEEARQFQKEEFFKLFTADMRKRLVEEQK
jgi:uncharacterized protein (TIGR04255 family)